LEIFSRTSGSSSALAISLCSRFTMSAGTPAGATTPYQTLTS
jgi:hypothetical protein